MKTRPASRARRLSAVQRAYDFLVSEGCSPRLIPDGDAHFSQLGFEYDGGLLAAGVDERDPDFLEVTLTLRRVAPLDEVTARCAGRSGAADGSFFSVASGRESFRSL
jgi:hypothetical protein